MSIDRPIRDAAYTLRGRILAAGFDREVASHEQALLDAVRKYLDAEEMADLAPGFAAMETLVQKHEALAANFKRTLGVLFPPEDPSGIDPEPLL